MNESEMSSCIYANRPNIYESNVTIAVYPNSSALTSIPVWRTASVETGPVMDDSMVYFV